MPTDAISCLFEHIGIRAEAFFAGPLCGLHDFGAAEGVGHLHVIRSGSLRVTHGEKADIEVTEPSFVFYARAMNHRLTIRDSATADVVCATVRYDVGRYNAITQSLPPVLVVPLAAVPRLVATLAVLFAEADDDRPGRKAMLDRLCEILVIQIVRFVVDTGLVDRGVLAGLSHPRLAKLLAALLAEPTKPWTVPSMAARSHLSRNAFTREFGKVVGRTPADFLADVRIALAQRLLRKGRPLANVAEEVGYHSQSAFSRAFIRKVGRGPTHWLQDPVPSD